MTLEPQPQPQPQPLTHRFSTCHRHPGEPFTGFCSSCLRERLSGLHPPTRREISGGGCNIASSSSLLLELRRCKSFSGGKRDGFSGKCEPRRKSCDVRARNSLWSLFNLDDERSGLNGEIEVEAGNLGFSEVVGTVFEAREEEDNDGEIKVFEEALIPDVHGIGKRAEEDEEIEEEVEVKTMKEHIDLEWQNRKHTGRDFKDIAGSFWVAASVFSKKLRKWRRKQKMKRRSSDGNNGGGGLVSMEVEKVNGRQLRETQSEIADYGFGRRSCDIDPRFSIDAGRVSLDCPRYSFDEPRASWDGNLLGRTFPRLTPMVSVCRNENRLSVEEKKNSVNEEERNPGGSAQTRDYYSDSSSRRRRSFDRSSSNRKTSAVEVDEMKSISNAKVSPTTIELFHGAKLLITERDLRDSNSSSLKDDHSESLDSASKDAASIAGGSNRMGFKKHHRWRKAWTIWGLIHKRSERKYEDVVEAKEAFGDKIIRSSSSVSSMNSCNMAGSRSMKSSADIKGHGKKRREHIVLERNRSARYSPNNLDNGLLRFYLTPLRSSRSKCGKSRLKNSHSIGRNVLRLY